MRNSDANLYKNLSNPDFLDMEERTKFRRGYKLLKRIYEELNPQEFSLAEITSMNASRMEIITTGPQDKIIRFGQSDLKNLLELGCIQEVSSTKYAITEKGDAWYEREGDDKTDKDDEDNDYGVGNDEGNKRLM